MPEASSYLATGFGDDRRELQRVQRDVENVVDVLRRSMVVDHWPYELKNHQPVEPTERYSQSTNAMILFALVAAARRLPPKCPLFLSTTEAMAWVTDLSDFQPVWGRLLAETTKLRGAAHGSHVTWSGTFGFDDPFTLTWLFELARSGAFGPEDEALRAIRDRAAERVRTVFESHRSAMDIRDRRPPGLLLWVADDRCKAEDAIKNKERRGRSALDHAFPVLRYIRRMSANRDRGTATSASWNTT